MDNGWKPYEEAWREMRRQADELNARNRRRLRRVLRSLPPGPATVTLWPTASPITAWPTEIRIHRTDVGEFFLERRAGEVLWIADFWIYVPARGRGLGHAAMHALFDAARAASFLCVEGEAKPERGGDLARLLRFYRDLGFAVTDGNRIHLDL